MQKKITNEDLAVMIAKGFAETASKQELAVVAADVAVLKTDVAILKEDVGILKEDVSVLKNDMSNVLLRLDNVPFKYEFKHLKNRVSNLEKKNGIIPPPLENPA